MVGFDDAAMMGLGAVNAGVQIAGQQYQKRKQKKLDKMGRAQEQRHFDRQIKELGLQQEDVNRQNTYDQQDIRENVSDVQGPDSSYQVHLQDRREGERSRRYDALEREKIAMQADWMDKQKAYKIQKKMQKNAQTMSMISSLLMQGASGGAGMMGASTMAGGQ